ncbi:hypothetical protein DY000_02047741 [Brassica cretica]|uniref:Uncharacterized protein n=1 Tax=Brassica cretica TaxID=69181 RepID=A0ABQ7EPL7_BRACR|nr:hypothetical protein DY000_02047741 [Brassica cretica]
MASIISSVDGFSYLRCRSSLPSSSLASHILAVTHHICLPQIRCCATVSVS